ncbi:MAG: AAA family ATPase, partial [Chitinivibrionia bacterium]|nr:AAA family ATPase [Chitinivibrionia bacterium]
MTKPIDIAEAARLGRKLLDNIRTVFIGKDEASSASVLSLMADGHILLEDVPGVGKTLLAKAIAKSIAGTFRRVQFTADLLPSDITGVTVFHQSTGEFRFTRGPVFANVLLADEINRATPRTQSSLLEAMEERQVTVDGAAHPIDRPFFVVATQNP